MILYWIVLVFALFEKENIRPTLHCSWGRGIVLIINTVTVEFSRISVKSVTGN